MFVLDRKISFAKIEHKQLSLFTGLPKKEKFKISSDFYKIDRIPPLLSTDYWEAQSQSSLPHKAYTTYPKQAPS